MLGELREPRHGFAEILRLNARFAGGRPPLILLNTAIRAARSQHCAVG